ncbi:MAG TPA: VOC family protein [Candidatus Limnocylindria bacterium]|nr:VOC family protein [Candidatus Limnocylindria bacterium]
MQKITPSLWFDKECEEAINFYIDTFNGAPSKKQESKIVSIMRYEKGMEAPGADQMEGKIITAIFELAGQQFMALDGGPIFKFNESISFQIECQDQAEVDYFWGKMSAVPESEQCGWIKDKYGLSWQIIPKRMGELLGDSDKKKALAATNAMLKMHKIDVAELEKAFNEA